jgi:hypothetical protein
MLILGVIACGVGTWGIVRAWPTARWDETTGTVTASSLIQVNDGPDEAEIAYEYRVAGRRYTGSRVGYLRFVSQRAAYRFLNDHPAGSAIAVYFDPRDPSSAVLQRGGVGTGVIMVAIGIALLLLRRRLPPATAAV